MKREKKEKRSIFNTIGSLRHSVLKGVFGERGPELMGIFFSIISHWIMNVWSQLNQYNLVCSNSKDFEIFQRSSVFADFQELDCLWIGH